MNRLYELKWLLFTTYCVPDTDKHLFPRTAALAPTDEPFYVHVSCVEEEMVIVSGS